jgi:hypothetical protein
MDPAFVANLSGSGLMRRRDPGFVVKTLSTPNVLTVTRWDGASSG